MGRYSHGNPRLGPQSKSASISSMWFKFCHLFHLARQKFVPPAQFLSEFFALAVFPVRRAFPRDYARNSDLLKKTFFEGGLRKPS